MTTETGTGEIAEEIVEDTKVTMDTITVEIDYLGAQLASLRNIASIGVVDAVEKMMAVHKDFKSVESDESRKELAKLFKKQYLHYDAQLSLFLQAQDKFVATLADIIE